MASNRYDLEWEEVKLINDNAILLAYAWFAFRGIGFLVVTWTTVALLGGFVSMIDEQDFWRLTMITLVEIICINVSFTERMSSSVDLILSLRTVKDLLTPNWQLADNAHGDHQELAVIKRVIAVVRGKVRWFLTLVHDMALYFCLNSLLFLVVCGMFVTTWISICGLMEHNHYGDKPKERKNMDPAHTVLYIMCVAQFALFMYRFMLLTQSMRIVKKVSQAYGFQDDGEAVWGYLVEIRRGCLKNPSSMRGRNLVTYDIELMESKSRRSCVSGTLILDRLLTRQHCYLTKQEENQQQQLDPQQQFDVKGMKKKEEAKEEREKKCKERNMKRHQHQHQHQQTKIIMQQRRMIKRLIGTASSTNILHGLLETLDSRRSSDRKMREATARIVEHVASRICLEQFPRGIQCISSLINTFGDHCRLQPCRSSNTNTIDATPKTLLPTPNGSNGQEQEQGSSSIYTSSSESKPEYSESESDSDSDSDGDPASIFELLTRLRVSLKLLGMTNSKGSNTATATSFSPKSESDNAIDRPSSSKVNRSTTNQFHDYKQLLLTGLRILWRLAGSEDNCRVISNTKHLVSKIMAPISYDLVHLVGHSAWSTQVVERSLGVILRLIVNTKGDTGADLRQQISSDKGPIGTMKNIVVCEECKGGELHMKAMQILTRLTIDETANRGNLTKVLLSIFINGDSNTSIRKTAGETLVLLFLSSSSRSVPTLLPKEENDEFVGDLAKIISQVGDDNSCRKSAAEILEHLCIQCAENGEYLSTLKNTITGMMPELLREICHGSTGEEEKPEYARSDTDVESQCKTKRKKKNKKNTSSSPGQNQQHKLDVALLSLCATACDKLHLDLDAISMGEGRDQATDPGESATFSLAMKMVQLNRDIITPDGLSVMKLTTRMVIAAMKKLRGKGTSAGLANLESLMDSLSNVSETMLDLEGCMVFAAGTTTTKPATVDSLNSLVKHARQLYGEIRVQGSEIEHAS